MEQVPRWAIKSPALDETLSTCSSSELAGYAEDGLGDLHRSIFSICSQLSSKNDAFPAFLRQKNQANYLSSSSSLISSLVFTRFRVICRRAENDHINEEKEVLKVGKNIIFQ